MFVEFPLISSRPSTIVASTNVSPEPVAMGVTVAVTESLARIIRVNPAAWISPEYVEPPSNTRTSESRSDSIKSMVASPPLAMWTTPALFEEVTVSKLAVPSTRRQVVVADWHSNPAPVIEPLFHTPIIESVKCVDSMVKDAPDSASKPPLESEIIACKTDVTDPESSRKPCQRAWTEFSANQEPQIVTGASVVP